MCRVLVEGACACVGVGGRGTGRGGGWGDHPKIRIHSPPTHLVEGSTNLEGAGRLFTLKLDECAAALACMLQPGDPTKERRPSHTVGAS